MNWRVGVLIFIVLLVSMAGGAYLIVAQRQPTPLGLEIVAPITPTPSITASTKGSEQVIPGWQTLNVKEHGFEIRYPKDWLLTTHITAASLPYPPRYFVNLVTGRSLGPGNAITVPFAIEVYDKPSFSDSARIPRSNTDAGFSSVTEWLSKGYGGDLLKAEKGDIDQALRRAYAGKEGVLSYNEFHTGNATVYEVGQIYLRGVLFYTTYFTRNGSDYVYGVGIDLQFEENASVADPPDSEFVGWYKLMVSSFRFID